MSTRKDITKSVIDYIEKNLENDLTLEQIAEYAGYSRFHLNRMFKEETGLTIHKYIQTRRLTLAAEKLVTSQIPVSQIAYEAGYESQQAFSAAFREVYLYPPKVYRKRRVFLPKQERIFMYKSIVNRYSNFSRRREWMAA